MRSPTLAVLVGLAAFVIPGALSAADTSAMPTPVTGWQQVGWGGGSYYWAAAWHPTDENVLYLGGDCAGAYRSDDKGKQWRFTNNGIRDYAVFTMAVSPAAPDLVYAMTDSGLSRSTDRAKTWQYLPDSAAGKLDIRSKGHGTAARAVAIDPRDGKVVYAGSHTGKLFKSVDGGTSWKELPYRDALPKSATPAAFHGAGALSMTYDSATAGMDTMGRVALMFGNGNATKDWSAYKKITAQVRAADASAGLQAQLVVQCGDKWVWQQGEWTDLAAGWSELKLDLAPLQAMDAVHVVYVVLRSPKAPYKGDVLLDAVALHGDAATTLAAGQDPAAGTVILADWEKKGDLDGWAANRQTKDSLHITAARQSQEQPLTGGVTTVAVAPGDPSLVYVANSAQGVFRSEDAGATWKLMDTPKKALGVTVSPTDPSVAWTCGIAGLFRTADRGKSWTAMTPEGAGGKIALREVALHAKAPGRVYVIGSEGWSGMLFRSDDDGRTWTRSTTVRNDLHGNPTNPEEAGPGGKGTSGLSSVTNIALNPRNPDELFICGNWRNVYSADGGKTLEERVTGADNTCTTDIQFVGKRTYATAMDEGLLVTENDGGEWKQLLPLKYDGNMSGHFWRVRIASVDGKERIVTTASPWNSFGDPKIANRAYISDDQGKTFTLSSAGLPDYVPAPNTMWGRSFPRALALDPKNPAVLYMGMDGDAESGAGREGGGVFRSADGGATWTRTAGQPGSRRMYYGLAVDPTDSKRLFWSACGTGGGCWRSEDEGATWQQVFKEESWSFNLEVAPSGAILLGANELYRSADHGATWKKLTNMGGGQTVVGIAVDPADEKRMWIARTTWSSAADGSVQRTTDGGATWQDITGDIPFCKPQILRYNAETKNLWAAGVGIYKIKQ